MVLALGAVLASCSGDARDHIAWGDRFLGSDRPEAALAEYQVALRRQGDEPEILLRLAHGYARLDRLDEAKEAYMLLFNHDRERSHELLEAMGTWVEKRRSDPGQLSSDTVEEFSQWVQKRGEIAAQTSALYGDEAAGGVIRIFTKDGGGVLVDGGRCGHLCRFR